MSTSRVDLKTGDIKDHLVRLTIPMIWGIAAIVSFQLVDTYYVSLLGTKPLAPFLVFGLAGFPRLELQGAAIATVFSNAVAMAAGLYVLHVRKKMILPFTQLHLEKFGDSCKRLLFIALPAGLTSAVNPLVNTLIIGLLAGYGQEAVAAFGIALRIEAFAFILLMALAVGMSPIIGQNFGARNFNRVHETLRKAIGFSVLWCIGVAVILMVFAEEISSAFSDDAIVIYYAVLSFMIVAPSYLFNSLVNGWSSAFNAMGKPQMSVIMTFVKMVVLMVPSVLIGAKLGGVMGIFAAISLVNIVTGLGFHLWSRHICMRAETQLALKTP